jgi:hypothetical protein
MNESEASFPIDNARRGRFVWWLYGARPSRRSRVPRGWCCPHSGPSPSQIKGAAHAPLRCAASPTHESYCGEPVTFLGAGRNS